MVDFCWKYIDLLEKMPFSKTERGFNIKVTRRGFRLRKSWFHLKSDPEGPWTAIIKVSLSSQVVFIWPSCREFLDI